ncbi:MAG TPA: hypothetical protein VF633_01415 [Brevundimonas sp.]|jgi:hypothetical protein
MLIASRYTMKDARTWPAFVTVRGRCVAGAGRRIRLTRSITGADDAGVAVHESSLVSHKQLQFDSVPKEMSRL